jgi:hypothetical protein
VSDRRNTEKKTITIRNFCTEIGNFSTVPPLTTRREEDEVDKAFEAELEKHLEPSSGIQNRMKIVFFRESDDFFGAEIWNICKSATIGVTDSPRRSQHSAGSKAGKRKQPSARVIKGTIIAFFVGPLVAAQQSGISILCCKRRCGEPRLKSTFPVEAELKENAHTHHPE